MNSTAHYASSKQYDFIKSLLTERELPKGMTHDEATMKNIALVYRVNSDQSILSSEASSVITFLMSLPRKKVAPKAGVNPGIYLHDGKVYAVVETKDKSRVYAKSLFVRAYGNALWVFAPGKVQTLQPSERLTVDEARAYGIKYGICAVCGRTLTDDTHVGKDGLTSLQRGIGPVCIEKVR